MSSAGTQKVLKKLEASLNAGQFYEAHEMFKTVYYRHRSRKQNEESYQLCQEGARLQLQQGQLNCGVELCMLLIEAYVADGLAPTEAAVQRVVSLIDAFPRQGRQEGEDPPVQECSKFVAAAVKWLRGAGGWQYEAQLEGRLAAYASASLGWQGLGFALPHYARAADAEAMAVAVASAAAHGSSEEEDLFVARAALTMAAARVPAAAPPEAYEQQLEAARQLLASAYPTAAGHPAPDTPLLHFVALFIEALDRRADELVQLLLQRYQPSLDRDPGLWELALKARSVHLPQAAGGSGGLGGLLGGGMGGMLGDMFRMLSQPA